MQEKKKTEQKEIIAVNENAQEIDEVFPQNEEHLINEAPEDNSPFDSPEEEE